MKSETLLAQDIRPVEGPPPVARPLWALSAGVSEVAVPLLLGLVAIVFAPLLHTASPVLAIATQSLIACAIAILMPGYAVAVAIFTLLFQSIIV